MGKRLDIDGKAQALLYAAVHGDEAASERFGVSSRSLRKYRAEGREEGTELSETFRRYAAALQPERRADDFAATLDTEAGALLGIFRTKAEGVNAANPEGLRAIGEMVGRLLDQRTALAYIENLFGGTAPEAGAPGTTEGDA